MNVRNELRRTVERVAVLTQRRDDLIRAALAENVRAVDVAADAGLSIQRIYQIRDSSR